MKTIKTISLLTLALLAVGYVVFGGVFGNMLGTAWRNTTKAAEAAIPLEFELDMVETELDKAATTLDGQRHRVAELEVACEDLRAEVAGLEERERAAMSDLRRHADAFEATGMGARAAVFDGRSLRPADVAGELRVASSRAQQLGRESALKRELLGRREKALEQARGAVTQFVTRRQELQVSLESRRMDLESTRLLSEVVTLPDASGSLARVEQRLDDVGRQIRIARSKAEAEAPAPTLGSASPGISAEEAYRQALDVLGAGLAPHNALQARR